MITRYDVYNGIAKTLAREDVQKIVQENQAYDWEERQVLETSILEVINALNFCIRYNWPISTYFKERGESNEPQNKR